MKTIAFDKYLNRILKRSVDSDACEAVDALLGENRIRELVKQRKSHRVCNIVRIIEGKLRTCWYAEGKKLRIDTGERIKGPFGIGRVFQRALVLTADLAVVEDDEDGRRFLAYVVLIRYGGGRQASGRFRKPLVETVLLDSLPVLDAEDHNQAV